MEQKERLINLIIESVNGCARYWAEVIADHLIENGIIVPPVKVGDTVWYIHGGYYRKTNLEARPITVTEISQKKVKDKLQWAFIANGTRYVFGSIGKTVFLSREDAEKALAERSKE